MQIQNHNVSFKSISRIQLPYKYIKNCTEENLKPFLKESPYVEIFPVGIGYESVIKKVTPLLQKKRLSMRWALQNLKNFGVSFPSFEENDLVNLYIIQGRKDLTKCLTFIKKLCKGSSRLSEILTGIKAYKMGVPVENVQLYKAALEYNKINTAFQNFLKKNNVVDVPFSEIETFVN